MRKTAVLLLLAFDIFMSSSMPSSCFYCCNVTKTLHWQKRYMVHWQKRYDRLIACNSAL